jgi:hypothetical protein
MTSDLKYWQAPALWSFTEPNPFSPDGSYGSEWTAFCILDREDDQFETGRSGLGPFSARFGRNVPHLKQRLIDFLSYENAQGRKVILSFPEGMDIPSFIAQALLATPSPEIVRPGDEPILVHSTTQAAWKEIQSDGFLKAASQLNRQKRISPGFIGESQVDEYLRLEPPEYQDYVMFGEMESYGSELVVASNQAGKFVMDINAAYDPGVRLYLDHHRIIRDGCAVRDGLHVLKVYRKLILEPYLLAAIGKNDIPDHHRRIWTPKEFVEEANKAFVTRVGH